MNILNNKQLKPKIIGNDNYITDVVAEQGTLVNELKARTFKTSFYEAIKNLSDNNWHLFFKEMNAYGNGKRVIALGYNEINDFSGSPVQRFPMTHNLLPDYEFVLKVLVRNVQRLTLKTEQYRRYFANKEGLNEFLALYKSHFAKSWTIAYNTAFLTMFGAFRPEGKFDVDGDKFDILNFKEQPNNLKSDKDTTNAAFKWTLKNIVPRINKALNYNVKEMKDILGKELATNPDGSYKIEEIFRALDLAIKKFTNVPTDTCNIGVNDENKYLNIEDDKDVENVEKFVHQATPDQLIVIGSIDDKNEFDRNYLSGVYNMDSVKLPKVWKYIWLNIPKGTFYVLEKDAIQIDTHLQIEGQEEYINDLTVDMVGHDQFYINFFPFAYGYKLVAKK